MLYENRVWDSAYISKIILGVSPNQEHEVWCYHTTKSHGVFSGSVRSGWARTSKCAALWNTNLHLGARDVEGLSAKINLLFTMTAPLLLLSKALLVVLVLPRCSAHCWEKHLVTATHLVMSSKAMITGRCCVWMRQLSMHADDPAFHKMELFGKTA